MASSHWNPLVFFSYRKRRRKAKGGAKAELKFADSLRFFEGLWGLRSILKRQELPLRARHVTSAFMLQTRFLYPILYPSPGRQAIAVDLSLDG